MSSRLFLCVLTAATASPLLARVTATAACPRAVLEKTAAQYRTALEMGWAGALEGVADNFTNVQNNRVVDISAGILFNGLTHIAYARTTLDEAECASYTEIVATDYTLTTRYVLGVQLRHDPQTAAADADTDNTSLFLVDTVVSTNGSRLFDAGLTLSHVTKEDWGRQAGSNATQNRTALRAIADAYLDAWLSNGTSLPAFSNSSHSSSPPSALFGSPCSQLDGSIYGPCSTHALAADHLTDPRVGASSGAPVERRYVIDASVGSVNVMSRVPRLGNAADSHEFRIENGRLRYVHAITATRTTKLSTDPGRRGQRG